MGNDVTAASVTVNVNRNSGSVSTKKDSGYLKSMSGSLKSLKNLSAKGGKLSMAGLGSASAILATGKLALAAAAVAAPFIAAQQSIDNNGRAGGHSYTNEYGVETKTTGYFQDSIVDGERKILEVNERTGEVVDILTEREATERKILDENGQIYEGQRAYKGKWKEVKSTLTEHGTVLQLSGDELLNLLTEQEKSVFLQKEYNRLQIIINTRKAREAQTKAEDYLENTGTRYTFGGSRISEDRPMNYMDVVHEQERQEAQEKQAQQQVSFVDDFWRP